MLKTRVVVVLLSILVSSFSWGFIKQEINGIRPLKCTFSKKHYNRIAVDEGFVEKVMLPEGYFSLHAEEESGQVFLLPQSDFSDHITLSVITGGGFVQDIEVSIEDKSAEVVVLKEPKNEKGRGSVLQHDKNQGDKVVLLLKTLLKGNIPEGYMSREVKEPLKITLKDSLEGRVNYIIEGPYLRIQVLEISNYKKTPKYIQEKDLSSPEVKWVYLEKEEVNPKEHIYAIIAERCDVL